MHVSGRGERDACEGEGEREMHGLILQVSFQAFHSYSFGMFVCLQVYYLSEP